MSNISVRWPSEDKNHVTWCRVVSSLSESHYGSRRTSRYGISLYFHAYVCVCVSVLEARPRVLPRPRAAGRWAPLAGLGVKAALTGDSLEGGWLPAGVLSAPVQQPELGGDDQDRRG